MKILLFLSLSLGSAASTVSAADLDHVAVPVENTRRPTESRYTVPHLGDFVITHDWNGPQAYTLVWTVQKLTEVENEQRAAGVFDECDDLNEAEMRTVLAVNYWRQKKRGLPFLKVDPHLMAESRSVKCIQGHSGAPERARAVGFKGIATDDVAPGPYATPEDAVRGWGMDRPGDPWTHADQMAGNIRVDGEKRDIHFNRLGVGVCPPSKNYVATFGRLDADVYKSPPKPNVVK